MYPYPSGCGIGLNPPVFPCKETVQSLELKVWVPYFAPDFVCDHRQVIFFPLTQFSFVNGSNRCSLP